MKQFKLLPLLPLFVTACGDTDCLSADCGLDSRDSSSLIDIGFNNAKTALEEESVQVPEDARERLKESLGVDADGDLTESCIPVAFMATRWFGKSNEFDGALLSLTGRPVADVDGRFAPARPAIGVFAGGYTPLEDDGGEDVIICRDREEAVGPRDATGSAGCTIEPEPTDLETTSPIGGTYRGDQTFRGMLTRGPTFLPVHGVWMATGDTEGIAIGVVLACDDGAGDAQHPQEGVRPESD